MFVLIHNHIVHFHIHTRTQILMAVSSISVFTYHLPQLYRYATPWSNFAIIIFIVINILIINTIDKKQVVVINNVKKQPFHK